MNSRAPPATILIVDDEPRNCRLLRTLLQPEGYLTRIATDGADALASIAQQAPDLILLDIMMPGMDGYKVASTLKADPATSNIPIIIVTQRTDRDAHLAGLNAGAEEFLMKPVDRAELWLRIRNLLRLKALADFSRSHGAILEEQVQARTAELQRFRAAMQVSGDGIVLVDRASMRNIDVNQTICNMVGHTREELLGMTPMDLFGAERAVLERDYDALIADNNSGANLVEGLCRHKDGSRIPVKTRRRALHTGDGWLIVGTVRDITADQRAALELRESEQRLRTIIETEPECVKVVNAQMLLVEMNPAGLAMLEAGSLAEAQAQPLIDFIAPEYRAAFAGLHARVMRGESGILEYEGIGLKGGRCWLETHAAPLGGTNGKAAMLLGVTRDITWRKRDEVRIRRLNRVYAMLSGINSAIVRIPEREALFREVCRIAVADGGFFLARIVEVDLNGKARIAATTESDARLFQGIVEEYNADPVNSASMLAVALRSEQPLISNDVAGDLRIPHRAALTKDGNYALALLPIIVERRIVGTIVLRSRGAGLFDEDELHLLRELVANLSFALEHIGKEARIRRLTRVYAVLSGINGLIVRVRDRDELFKQACRIAVEQGRFRLAWIGLVDRAEMTLVPVASAGSTDDLGTLLNQGFSLAEDEPAGNSFSAQAIREKKASVCNDVQNDPRIVFKDQHAKRGSRSMVILPLQIGGEVMGLLALYSDEIGFFDDEELKLLTELAGDIAFAVDHIDKRDRLDYLAYYDELTGLANRSLFLERVAQYIRSAADGAHQLALFFVDLERFRNINDSLGRAAGDALLKLVSAWLSRAVGDPALLARLGADHFAVVLPKLKQGGNVASLVDKCIQALLDHSFHLNHTEFRIAAKVGVALFPADGADAETLLRNAEVALKKAKARGERFLFYKQKMTESAAGKPSLETQLRHALENEEFILHYQPKFNLESRKLTGAEALIRWNNPRTGLVPPGRFIPVLEETGLIMDVGRWALRKAIADYLRWRAAGLPAVRIAVNVSPLQLRHRGFTAEIEQVLGIHAAAAAGLELEITESLIMDDVQHNIASLQAIRALGVTIAIDDFGTGFSSLSYLARLPVDTLKIDRSFVIDMTTGPQGLALIPAIINLAHSLKLKVVAEGVETEEQARLLRLLRCDEMQGFLLSKPVPAEIFQANFLAPAPASAAA